MNQGMLTNVRALFGKFKDSNASNFGICLHVTAQEKKKSATQKRPTAGLKCFHLASLIVCNTPFAASTPLARHFIERSWGSVTAIPPQSSVSSRDTTETVTIPTPRHPVANAVISLKPTPARSIPWRGLLVGEIFANAAAACCVRAFLAIHLGVGQRAQRRLNPNRDLALRESHLLSG